ncbi:MAG: DUF1573 domain-containing protein [Saprospiraceae bacterium]|nr:DUF1573 domain-containing protein [Saprospiraceae bacterium]
MKKVQLFSFVLFAALMAISACKSDKTEAGAGDAALTADATATNVADPGAAGSVPPEAAPTGPTTTMEFAEMVHDWGELKEGEHMKYSFKFKNTGSEPLIISDAKGSCGCTVPDWPREPIAPGASGEIKVEFDSKGKGSDDGQKQTKKVTVTANTNPPQTYLTITGVVRKDPNAKPATSTN